uniref:Uncharacterized protein n=1 Tax=Meloidogyne javanica TaxID=6303 RepID=A0A915LVP0_MELJA
MNSSSNSSKIKNAIQKIKSNRGGTRQSATSDTSSISTEDEFVCVKRPKMKEIGTMTSKMDIPKVEQNTDVLFNFLNFIVELFKAVFNKAKNIAFLGMDWMSTIRQRPITKDTIEMKIFSKNFTKIKQKMDPNSDKLTQTNVTRNTSLTSLESGFVSLNEPKTKEQMTVEIDLISGVDKERQDAKIISKSGKISRYGKDLVEKINGFVKKRLQIVPV